MSKDLPKRTVANAFIIQRVPENMPITRDMLISNIYQDIADSAEQCGFHYSHFARRETPERTLKVILQRKLLDEKHGLISRNERTDRYIKKVPKKVTDLIDSLPVCDPLILLAGAGEGE